MSSPALFFNLHYNFHPHIQSWVHVWKAFPSKILCSSHQQGVHQIFISSGGFLVSRGNSYLKNVSCIFFQLPLRTGQSREVWRGLSLDFHSFFSKQAVIKYLIRFFHPNSLHLCELEHLHLCFHILIQCSWETLILPPFLCFVLLCEVECVWWTWSDFTAIIWIG